MRPHIVRCGKLARLSASGQTCGRHADMPFAMAVDSSNKSLVVISINIAILQWINRFPTNLAPHRRPLDRAISSYLGLSRLRRLHS
jgi:hypothetical protein